MLQLVLMVIFNSLEVAALMKEPLRSAITISGVWLLILAGIIMQLKLSVVN